MSSYHLRMMRRHGKHNHIDSNEFAKKIIITSNTIPHYTNKIEVERLIVQALKESITIIN